MTFRSDDNRRLWEERYKAGKSRVNYPYDQIVGFMLGRYPPDRRVDTKVLDFGCGTGNHLWFLVENGFDAYGVDSSATAVELARSAVARIDEDFDDARIKVIGGDALPFEDGMFDVVLDRSSLGQNRAEDIPRLVAEIERVLKPGGVYFGINFSDHHAELHRARNYGGGDFADFDRASLKDIGIRHFFGVAEIFDLFGRFNIEDIRVLDDRSLFGRPGSQQLAVVATTRARQGAADAR